MTNQSAAKFIDYRPPVADNRLTAQVRDLPKQITLHIGEYFAGGEDIVIKTLLGSCVAVCLFDPVTKIGAMNHIFLPGKADMKRFDAPARYGINAMELLINRVLSLGANRYRLTAKAFGGAHILPGICAQNSPGRKITEFVMAFLETESIPLIGYDLGGYQGRQIRFHTRTGDVFVKRITPSFIENICSEEWKSWARVSRKIKKSGEITLFARNEE